MTRTKPSPEPEVARLEERLRKLAAEKSNLQLVNQMMQRLSSVSGLTNTIEQILQIVVDHIGGTNLILYYFIDQQLFFCDLYGKRGTLDKDSLSDTQLAEVLASGKMLEYAHEFSHTQLLTSHFTSAWTCLCPLMVGADLLGVLHMENLHVASRSLQPQLSVFMNFAALILKNEISGYSQLEKAYERLQEEIAVRRASETELRDTKESLEEKVIERTNELSLTNQRLEEELAQRHSIQARLAESEARYRSLFEDLPVSVWEEDFSAVQAYFNQLRASGVGDIGAYLRSHNEAVTDCANLVKFEAINSETLQMLGLTSIHELNPDLRTYFTEESLPTFRDELIALAEGRQRFWGEIKIQPRVNELKELYIQLRVVPGYEASLGKVLVTFIDITARKMAEQALRRSEQHLRSAEQMANVGSWEADIPSGKNYWSEQTFHIFGLGPEAAVPSLRTGMKLIHPADQAKVRAAFKKAVTTSGALEAEFRLVHPDGEVVWVEVHGAVARSAEGIPFSIQGSILDITQRKLADDALRASEVKLRTIFERSSDAIGVSKQGIHILFNPAYLNMFGYTEQELMGKPVVDLIAPEARARVAQYVRNRAIGDAAPPAYETRGLRKNDTSFDMELRVSLYALDSEVYTLVLLRDVTEQKRAREALSQSEELFRQLAENVHEVMWVRNYATHKIEYVNPAYETVWGRSRESLYEQPETFTDAIYPHDAEILREALRQQYEGTYLNVQVRVLRPDGEIRWIWAHSYPVNDAMGQAFRFVGIAEDITVRKQQEEQTEMEQRRLQSLLSITHMEHASTQELLNATVEEAKKLSASSLGFIAYFDKKKNDPSPQHSAMAEPGAPQHVSNEMQSTATWAQVVQDKKTVIANNLEKSSEFDVHSPGGELPLKRVILLPVIRADKVFAVVGVGNKDTDYTTMDASQLRLMMGEVVKIIERAQAEERLQASLNEKSALLKEIHHRVKNNMQVMISLLQMQANQVNDERVRGMFHECRDRIYSMALVHEQLYSSTNLAQIHFGDYIERLVYDLHNTYNITMRIRLDMHINPVNLPIELAVPCGLMINEIVTNAFKHAFPDGRAGIVSAELRQEGDIVILSIGDNGTGMAAGIVPEKTDSLGLKLIHLLSRQVGGDLQLERDNGTRFTLRFNINS
jgi:PAS domain S-box-containing protein